MQAVRKTPRRSKTDQLWLRCEALSCPDKSGIAWQIIVFPLWLYHSLGGRIPLLPLLHTHTHTPLPSTNTQSKHFALLIRVWLLLRKQEHKGAGIMTASVNMNPWHSRPFSDKRLNRSLMKWAAPKLRRSGQQCVMNSLSQYFNACLCVHGRTARVWADPHHSWNVDHSVSQINYS